MRHEAVPNGSFVLRTPLYSIAEAFAWGEGLEAPGSPGDAGALERDRARLRERLRAFYGRAEVQEALFLASPKLARRSRA